MSKNTFNKHEKIILNTLYQARRPLTTNQISKRTGMAWQTANKYLKRLYRNQHLRKKTKGRSTKWRLRTE